ncbi:ATP-dependent zinc protease family protein [Endozoicomonas numazuensis]|uniref:ATP-dependent zinc protease family protein n=1 Tax=Endozoicomonas numazuensis TaxID=1137799 RepID=UPI000689DE3A|nr:RimK/LysX family protein [Endozoicomonas numazuensis]
MTRFPALPAVILAISALTGCQVLQQPAQTTDSQKTPQTETESPKPEQKPGDAQGNKPSTPSRPDTLSVKQQLVQTPARVGGKLVLGFAEKGTLTEYGLELNAKIDTGAGRSSIDARNIENFERDGKKWVRFDLPRTSKGNVTLELPVKDTILIKRPGGEESQARYIVNMNVKVGDITQNLDVSLNDRTRFEFPLLIGRDFLKDMAIADVGKQYIASEKVLDTVTRKIPADDNLSIKEQIDKPVDISGLALVGELEQVHVKGFKNTFKARIDTGAKTSSIDARDIEFFEKEGTEWVRFKVVHGDESQAFEREVHREIEIKRHGGLENQDRVTVFIPITLGKISRDVEFTLTDRAGYEYPILIGERFLSNTALVDVAQQNIAELKK